MATARDIIKGAMRLLGVLRQSEEPTADEASDALTALNGMLSTWSNDGLLVYAQTWENFTLTANDGEYTIGTGQQLNTTRPVKIEGGYVRQGSTDYPLAIIDAATYDKIPDKSITGIPEFLNYDPQYPYAKIRLYPVPAAADGLYLRSEKLITSFAALATTVSLPEGWEEGLKHGLAKRLAPEYGVAISPDLGMAILETVGAIKRTKARAMNMEYDVPPVRQYNIMSDE